MKLLSKVHVKKSVEGFTLIELMVVIALFAFITTLAMANISFLNRFIARTELDHLYMACRYMQHKACATHQEQTITFNLGNNSYSFAGHKHVLPVQIKFGVLPDSKGPPSAPRRAINKPITFKNNTVVCYPTGIIAAGTAYLTDNKQCMYALSCPVSSVSYIRKYRYANGWKLIT